MRFPFARLDMSSTRNTVAIAKQNANRLVANALAPKRMAIAAPSAAPWDAPRISGDTSGFWKVPWNAAPAAARQQPTISASRIRGRRTLKNSVCCWFVQNWSMGNTWPSSMQMASWGSMGNLPSISETDVMTTKITARAMMTKSSRREILLPVSVPSSFGTSFPSNNATPEIYTNMQNYANGNISK